MSDRVSVSELRRDTARLVDRARKSRQPLVITRRGRAAAVMVSVESYQRSEHERALLRALLRGQAEIASGRGHALDDVMADADCLLEE